MAATGPIGIQCKGGRVALPKSLLKSIGIGTVYPGTLTMSAAAGYLLNGADTASCKFEGVAKGGGTATSNGQFGVPVYTTGVFKFKNSTTQALTQANVGGHAYVEDNETVCKTAGSTNKVRVGIVESIDTDGVWISIRTEVFKETPDLENGGDDEIDMTGILPGLHASTHELAGSDVIDLSGLAADDMALTLTGAIGTDWVTSRPAEVDDAFDRIAAEVAFQPGGPIPVTPRLANIYVNAATGLDANPGTAALPVLTMDRAMELVPPSGFCTVRVTGDAAWAGGVVPYAGYRGHLRIIATNAFTDAGGGADVTAGYVAAGGGYGQDQVTPTALVPADATDRSRFLLITEDVGAGGATHMVRVLEVAGGVWLTEPRGLTVTGANAISLVEPTSTLAPVAAITTGSLHNEGDVMLVGFNLTSPGADGLTGFAYAACVIDGTADVHAVNMGPNTNIGGCSIDGAYADLAPAMYCPAASLTGSALQDLVADWMPGCHLTMAGGASFLRMIASSAPGCGRIEGTVWEAGDVYVGNPASHLTMEQFRGVLAASGLQVMDGCTVTMGNGQLGDLVQADWTQIILTDDIGCTSVASDGHMKAAGVGGNESVIINDATKAAGSDTYAYTSGPHARRQGITINGNMWPAATAQVLVQIDGISDDLRLTLPTGPGVDCGIGDMVEVLGGYHYLGPCTGDNANAGGTGMSLLGLGTRVSAQNGFAITGNAGGTTTIGIGSLGHTALPGAGVVKNEFPAAGALTSVEQLCVFEHRA